MAHHQRIYDTPKFEFWRGASKLGTGSLPRYVSSMSSTATLPNEFRAVTEGCGLIDRSERGKLALAGGEAKTFLQGQVSNDVESLAAGAGCYAALLTPKGKMLGDLRILDTGEELLLDTERLALQALFNAIRRTMIGYDVELRKRTLERGLLSLIGPEAAVLAEADELASGPEHAHMAGELGGLSVRKIRTDVGVDLLCDAGDTPALRTWLEASGAVALSEATAETVRVEHGRPRYGIDLDDTVIPQEAGLNERAVSFTKGCYVGQETVARLYYRGKPNRHLRGLRLSAPARSGEPVRDGEREVGKLGSIATSPRLGPIALAILRREVALGATVSVGDGEVTAQVVELPFV
jgi:tRNA-modifying protein YgfZ